MNHHGITPDKVTKPIQLLAAWLIGLFVTNGSFLLAAQNLNQPPWGSALLLIAAVINVPLFIGALFLLQTKFRPQMQEDSFYSRYLDEERKFHSTAVSLSTTDLEKEISQTVEKIVKSIGIAAEGKEQPIATILRDSQTDLMVVKHGSSRSLSELFKAPETWNLIVHRWKEHRGFNKEVNALVSDGLAEKTNDDLNSMRLTNLGVQVATQAEAKQLLFSQTDADFWEQQRKKIRDRADAQDRGKNQT